MNKYKHIVFALCLLSATTAWAQRQTAYRQRGAYSHDGFFLRLNLAGFGFAKVSASLGPDDVEYNGMAGFGDLGIGGAVSENLIIHGNVFGPIISRPTFRHNGTSLELDEATNINLFGMGGGITYYFMPYNMYLTVVLGMARLRVEQHGDAENITDLGFSGQLAFGKEWWVSPNWGLGVAATLMFQRLQSDRSDDYWSGHGLGLMFSVTYN